MSAQTTDAFMKTIVSIRPWNFWPALFALCTLVGGLPLHGQNSAFLYSGQFDDNNYPANGSYDFRFTLFAGPSDMNPVGVPVVSNAVIVAKGVFTVLLDFPNAFDGSERWLEIEVRTNGIPNLNYTKLSPRVPVTPAPYAITAENLSGTVAASQISGTLNTANLANGAVDTSKLANGAVDATKLAPGAVANANLANGAVNTANLVNGAVDSAKLAPGAVVNANLANGAVDAQKLANSTVDATKLAAGAPVSGQVLSYNGAGLAWTTPSGGGGPAWLLSGNTGTDPSTFFLGTTDNKALTLRVNNVPAWRLLPAVENGFMTPAIIGGSSFNQIVGSPLVPAD